MLSGDTVKDREEKAGAIESVFNLKGLLTESRF